MDADLTLTSQRPPATPAARPLLGLTILWHPERGQIGAQFIGDADAAIELGRYAPAFRRLDGQLMPLADARVARLPLGLRRDGRGGVAVRAPASRMHVELNGKPLADGAALSAAQIEHGAVIGLGGAVLLCVHWVRQLPRPCADSPLLGVSDAALVLRALVRQAAATELPVLLLGETGTGKEVAARAIHAAGARRHAPLVAVNMATLGESLAAADLFGAEKGAYTGALANRPGYFAQAADGTLFLDEIGDTPAPIQPMLLRVLEDGEYRPLGAATARRSAARLIAATDQDLTARAFNQPLLRRLEGFVIHLPPLRQRRQDIGLLIADVVGRWERDMGGAPALPAALVGALCRHDWPGNVRQLQNVTRRALLACAAGPAPALADLLGEPATPAPAPGATATPARRPRLDTLSDDAVAAAMEHAAWQIQAAARALGISRPSLYKLLERHPSIRRPEKIPADEIRRALAVHGADLAKCAAALRTPGEALRRHVRANGLAG